MQALASYIDRATSLFINTKIIYKTFQFASYIDRATSLFINTKIIYKTFQLYLANTDGQSGLNIVSFNINFFILQ